MSFQSHDHHRATLQAATDTWPSEPFHIYLDQVITRTPIGDRSPALVERGFSELIYRTEGFPVRISRALVTQEWIDMALGWWLGFPSNLPVAEELRRLPFAPERQAPPAIAAPAPEPAVAPRAPRRRRTDAPPPAAAAPVVKRRLPPEEGLN
jgi:hypothetical protein